MAKTTIAEAMEFVLALRRYAAGFGLHIPAPRWNCDCKLAEDAHRRNKRFVAHTGHQPNTICLARGFFRLPRAQRYGILTHEIGHLMAGLDGPGPETRADRWVLENLEIEILYDLKTTVEYLDGKAIEAINNESSSPTAADRSGGAERKR